MSADNVIEFPLHRRLGLSRSGTDCMDLPNVDHTIEFRLDFQRELGVAQTPSIPVICIHRVK